MNESQTVDVELKDRGSAFWPDASLIGVALIWGVNIPLMKSGLEVVDVYVFNAIRLVVSAAVLAAFALREWQRGVKPKAGISFRQILIHGLFVSAIYQLLFLGGIATTTSGNTALIISTVPIWTALLARIFLAERLRVLAWWGLSIALVGTIIVALQKGDVAVSRQHLVGNITVLGAAMMWASGTVYSRSLLTRISPMQLAAASAVVALPIHLLVAAGRYGSSLPALQSIDLWMIILYAGVLSSGLALPMWNFGVRHTGAAQAAIIQNLIPVIAILATWVGRGEPPTVAQVVGGILILGGLVMMRSARRSPTDSKSRSA